MEAFFYFEGLPEGASKDQLRRQVLDRCLSEQGTALYFQQTPVLSDHSGTLSDLCLQLGKSDPGLALDAISNFASDFEKDQLVEDVALDWAQRDVEGVFDYAQHITNTHIREQFIAGIITGLAQETPGDASLLVQVLPPGDLQDHAIRTIAAHWAELDPSAAADWAVGLPNQPVRDEIIAGIAAEWAQTQPTESIAWAETLPTGPARDAALQADIQQLSLLSPEVAISWAQATVAPDRLNGVLIAIVRGWITTDSNAATSWIARSNLTEAERTEIVSPKRQG